ncbi:type I-E CRISPR-associated endoribonuclease Cas2e [Neisseriaceae bacterium TC5R-5]|nr:type I-E CRISPR-associated endoribonuclease Cas2e [Neisseriaceae bacterium TC5R-5]
MLVVIANDLPPAVRGRMKLWFIEPRPNVFVSGIKDATAQTVVDYLCRHCPPESAVMIIKSISTTPGYSITTIGPSKKQQIQISGLQLIVETLKSF